MVLSTLVVPLTNPTSVITAMGISTSINQTIVTIPPDIIIFQNGTNYQANNGTTGKQIASSTSASNVVQTAEKALPTNSDCDNNKCGGKIVFKEGTYPIHIIPPTAHIVFEGDSAGSTYLNRDGNKPIFDITGNNFLIASIQIMNFKINGGGYTYSADCIFAKQTAKMVIQKVTMVGCDGGNGIYFEQVYDTRLIDNYFDTNGNVTLGKAAVYLYSGSTESANHIYFLHDFFYGNHGNDILSKALSYEHVNYAIVVDSSKFESHNGYNHTHINFTSYTGLSVISNSFFESALTDNVFFCSTCNDNKIIGSDFHTNAPGVGGQPSSTQYNLDVEGTDTQIIGNSMTGASGTIADIKVGSGADRTTIIANDLNTFQGVTPIIGTLSNVKTLLDDRLGWNLGNMLQVNTTTNAIVLGGTLKLGGVENANSFQINNLAVPTHSTDAQNANHLGLLGRLVVGPCANNQILKWQASNSTWVCASNLSFTHFLVGQWDTEKVLINIGSIFADVYTTRNSNGHAIQIDTNGFTQVKYQVAWSKPSTDTGIETCQLVDPTNAANVLIKTSSLSSGTNTGFDSPIPVGLQNVIHDYKWQCKSTTGSDTPSWLDGRVWLKP